MRPIVTDRVALAIGLSH